MNLKYGIKNNRQIHLDQEDILGGFDDRYAYEVIRLIKARPLFFDLHYERLVKTCLSLNFPPPKSEELLSHIEKLTQENGIRNNNFKIAVDRKNLAVFPILSSYPSVDLYLRGVSCALLFEERENPEIKAFQSALREKSNEQMSQEEIFESVLINQQNQITEGSRSNLFFIIGQKVFTAPDHLVLSGITRMKILELLNELSINVKMEALSLSELAKVEAAFICGTSPGVLPICNIEDFRFDVKNPILQKIHHAYHQKYLEIINQK